MKLSIQGESHCKGDVGTGLEVAEEGSREELHRLTIENIKYKVLRWVAGK